MSGILAREARPSAAEDPHVSKWRPRVLVVPPSYFAARRTVGGGERYAFEYARALSELTPTTLGLLDRDAATEFVGKLEIRTFGVTRVTDAMRVHLTRASWRELGRFEVIHPMIFPTPLTDMLILSGRLRGQRIVLTDVGGGASCASTYLRRIWKGLDLNRLAHGLALLSDHASRLLGDWPQPRTVLYGGVDLTSFGGLRSAGEGYALFVGRLLPHKGVLELIRAIGPDTPLHVVGRAYDDEYLGKLREAARDKRVRFLLDADDAELGRQYAGAAVVVQPSLPYGEPGRSTAELLGLVALEGMAHGKPVVVTRTASLPELVLHGETGYIVEPDDPQALGERVEQLLREPELARRLGAAAREHVERNFTWDGVARRGLALYRRLQPARGGD